jgi:actin-like ATPase involved in cell morphogenesis
MRFDYLARISLNNLRPLLSLFSADLAIDLGTVNTRVYAQGRGIVVNEPSAVALDDRTGEVQAVGKEAKEMLGRPPAHIRVVRPLKNGVIADFKVTEKMLSYFMTATSVVPPPMSTTKLPPGSVTGRPAPMAAIIACSTR